MKKKKSEILKRKIEILEKRIEKLECNHGQGESWRDFVKRTLTEAGHEFNE